MLVNASNRPTLPLGWVLSDQTMVVDFIERRHFVEVYKLSDESFIYLFCDKEVQSKIKSRQIDHEIVVIGGKQLTIKRYPFHDSNEFIKRINTIISKTGLEAVAGMDELKQVLIRDVVHPFSNREKYRKYKLGIPNGILLYGPPGCGKTYIARKVAEEINVPVIEIKESDVGSPYIHATSGNIAKAFNEALRLAPSIVFIDEISGLLPKREFLGTSQQYRESEINEILIQIESAGAREILVIGATNFPDRMDPAALRSGRMDKRIFIPPPDYSARVALFKMELDDRPIDSDVVPELLGTISEGFVSSDIKLIVDNAARKALSSGADISMEFLIESLKEMQPSLSAEEICRFKKFKSIERK